MAKKSLESFNFSVLNKIMQDFASERRIFNSEAQFQFALAWKIYEFFDCKVNVLLEELSRIYYIEKELKSGKKKECQKKDYTDIILEQGGTKIAIELKYKTAILQHEQLTLSDHGAVDLGSYDFMWDVNRLQKLTGKTVDNTIQIRCDRGYAVILTNDNHYWTQPKNWDVSNQRNNKGINRMFRIHGDKNGNGILTKGTHEWYDTNGNPGLSTALQHDKSRAHPIKLKKDYPYKWSPYLKYDEVTNGEFKFMIVEVD